MTEKPLIPEIVPAPSSGALTDALSVDEVVRQITLIHKIYKEVMKENQHYGVIPGCQKPSLYKAGAEKLAFVFRLAPKYIEETTTLPNGNIQIVSNCILYHKGRFISSAKGSATSLETKHRYRYAPLHCPVCGKDGTVIKGKDEYGGGWLCFKKSGGCGAKWPDGAQEIENQERGKIENPDPADVWNTVLKMAQKRAFVAAILTATAASDIFTQDIEDLPDGTVEGKVPGKPADKKPDPPPAAAGKKPEPEKKPPVNPPANTNGSPAGLIYDQINDLAKRAGWFSGKVRAKLESGMTPEDLVFELEAEIARKSGGAQ